jgi:glycosyltransferase involved in cell wall biosynthesis
MTLLLFFTRGVSLKIWSDSGLLDREKLIYEEHLNKGNLKKVYWLTYGCNDASLSNKLKHEKKLHSNIIVLGMPNFFKYIPRKIGSYIYSFLAPIIYPKILRDSDILKTNQIDGSWCAVFSKWFYRKPLLLRTGYTISTLPRANNRDIRSKFNRLVESFAYRNSNYSIVSSYHNYEYIKKHYLTKKSKCSVLYNYIDLNLFTFKSHVPRYENRILYVGRLNNEKNLFNLIKAISQTSLILDIYGQGEIESELKTYAKRCSANVNFCGVVSNTKLAEIYKYYMYYVLISFQEGMPKTLLEAMASGCFCIGSDVAGINEIIKDNINGVLSKTTKSDDIVTALNRALQVSNKQTMIKNGVNMVNESCSLSKIVDKEFLIFKDIVHAN